MQFHEQAKEKQYSNGKEEYSRFLTHYRKKTIEKNPVQQIYDYMEKNGQDSFLKFTKKE